MLGELCTPSLAKACCKTKVMHQPLARLAHASPAEKDGLRPDSIARTGNLSPGSRTQASAQQGSPQSGDCSNWLNGNLCLQKVQSIKLVHCIMAIDSPASLSLHFPA